MALSFKEIRKIQIELRQIQQKMKDKNLRFKEIRAAQIAAIALFKKLNTTVKIGGATSVEKESTPVSFANPPVPLKESALLKALIAGEYDDLEQEAYVHQLNKVYEDIQRIDPLRDPVLRYLGRY